MRYTEAAFKALQEKAIKVAMERHAGQLYGNDKPYTWHLRHVADNVKKWSPYLPFGTTVEQVVVAAWLHDAIEDTGMEREEIAAQFGTEVAELVWRVSNEPGKNRKERHAATYSKIRGSDIAVFLKLMDRISNIEAGGKTGMYVKEYVGFREALYGPLDGYDAIWQYMEEILEVK